MTSATTADPRSVAEPAGRWMALTVFGVAILLAEAPWFSAAAVTPLIAADWSITGLEVALLTVAVQLGFAAGALLIAVTGVAMLVTTPE